MKLTLTKRAERNFFTIKAYIISRFGELVAEKLEQNMIDFLNLLLEFPKVGSIQIEGKQIRAFGVTEQTTIFYRIKDQQIIVLAFFGS